MSTSISKYNVENRSRSWRINCLNITIGFKFLQNWAINEEFYFWGGKILFGGPTGGRVARFLKIEKSLYRTVISTHDQNLSILAELKSVQKSGTFGGVLGPRKGSGGSNFKNLKETPYRMVIRTYSQNFSTLAQLESVQNK